MERTSDFEKLLFLYKTEGKGISLEQFCINNGINYRAFNKWYRNHHEDVVQVQVVGAPEDKGKSQSSSEKQGGHETLITVSLSFSNGMYMRHKNLTFANIQWTSQLLLTMGVKVLKYLQSFFKKFSEGCRDYAQMQPGQLAID